MRIAVTGAAGHLGSVVTRRLARLPGVRSIVALDVAPFPPSFGGEGAPVETVRCDVRAPELQRWLHDCSAVVHMAFIVSRWTAGDLAYDVNVRGSGNLFRAAVAAGVDRVVYASSIAAYGVVPGHGLPLEEGAPRRWQPELPYAAHKFLVEQDLDDLERRHPQVAFARLRPSIALGGRGDVGFGALLASGWMLDTGAPLPLVWDEDVADAFALAVEQRARGAFNIGTEGPITARELARITGARMVPLPRPVVSVAAHLAVLLARLGIGTPSDPAWLKAWDVSMSPATSRARDELGWRPRCRTGREVAERFATRAGSSSW